MPLNDFSSTDQYFSLKLNLNEAHKILCSSWFEKFWICIQFFCLCTKCGNYYYYYIVYHLYCLYRLYRFVYIIPKYTCHKPFHLKKRPHRINNRPIKYNRLIKFLQPLRTFKMVFNLTVIYFDCFYKYLFRIFVYPWISFPLKSTYQKYEASLKISTNFCLNNAVDVPIHQ